MSAFKKAVVFLAALLFGTLLLLVVSYTVSMRAESVAAQTDGQSWEIDADGLKKIDLTIELGRVEIVAGTDDRITVNCVYPAKDYLDNQVKLLADRDKDVLYLRLNSKRKTYFFGMVKDKACDITITLPSDLVPALAVKIQAGELTVGQVELASLDIDGDIAEIEVNNPGVSRLKHIKVHNNVGNITAYLSNLPERTHTDFEAVVNIGDVDFHLETDDQSGYLLEYIYNIGALSTQNGIKRGLGKNGTITAGKKTEAFYYVKTDIGTIHVFEDQSPENE